MESVAGIYVEVQKLQKHWMFIPVYIYKPAVFYIYISYRSIETASVCEKVTQAHWGVGAECGLHIDVHF